MKQRGADLKQVKQPRAVGNGEGNKCIYLILLYNTSPPTGRLLRLLHRMWGHAQGATSLAGPPAEKRPSPGRCLHGVKQARE